MMGVHKNCRLAYGSVRQVLLMGELAIKIPSFVEWRLFLLGLLANLQEVKFSKTKWPELCPVIWSLPLGFLIIMRRARIMTDEEFLELDLERWIENDDYIVPTELKSDSFGYLDGNIVVVDYGN